MAMRSQVNLKVEPELLARIDAEAERLGQTRTMFILRGVEAGLLAPIAAVGSLRPARSSREVTTHFKNQPH